MDPFTVVGIVVVVVLSITSHEAAHAWVADRLGDPTARQLGRVTLDPRPHIDPMMTVILPGFLIISGAPFIFGGAKPVPVQIAYLNHPRRDWALVAIAGPVCNFLLAFLLTGLFTALLKIGIWEKDATGALILVAGIFANVLLGLFNLLPIPPLDGSRVIQYFLHGRALKLYTRLDRYGIFILVGVLLLAPQLFWGIMVPAMNYLLDTMTGVFGVEAEVNYALRTLFLG